jgi:hypothetical protein
MSTEDYHPENALKLIRHLLRTLRSVALDETLHEDHLVVLVPFVETVVMDLSNHFFRTSTFSTPSVTPAVSKDKSQKIVRGFALMKALGCVPADEVLEMASSYVSLSRPGDTDMVEYMSQKLSEADVHAWDDVSQLMPSPMVPAVLKKLLPETVVCQQSLSGVEKILSQLVYEMIARESNPPASYASWVARLIDTEVLSAAGGIFLKTLREQSSSASTMRVLELVAAYQSVPTGWQQDVLVQATVGLWLSSPSATMDFDGYLDMVASDERMENMPVPLVMSMLVTQTEELEVWAAHKRRHELISAVTARTSNG